MTRQEAYVAELSQLLFYMTPWDKAEVLKGITAMVNHPETGLQTMEEMGTPMKLAVTLHRQYTPTPEPTPEELAAKAAAEAAKEEAVEEIEEVTAEFEAVTDETAEEAAEEAPAVEETAEEVSVAEEAAEEVPAAEEAAEELPAEEETAEEVPAAEEAAEEVPAAEEAAEELPAAEEAGEELPAAEETAEEVPAAEKAGEELPAAEEAGEELPAAEKAAEEENVQQLSLQYEEKIGQEKIFAEIFNAATEAQSAVPVEEIPVKETKRKARYLFLIPYIALAVVIGVPATLVFAVANVAVLAASLVSLCTVVYLVIFQFMGAAVLSTKLLIIGLTLLALAVTIMLSVMTVWFLRTATVGFPRFLIEIAKTHGYREVEVQ